MKHLTSSELLKRTQKLIARERRITAALIEHLAEIERRRLYAEIGFSSLGEYAVKEWGLSEGAAQRRIQAARLCQDVPEAKARLESGTLSLSNAAKVQSFRQAERKLGRKRDARELVQMAESLSQRQCEAKLFTISPAALPKERERIVSEASDRELKLVISRELYEKLQRLQGLLAHALPQATYAELLEYLANAELARLEKAKGMKVTAAAAVNSESASEPALQSSDLATAAAIVTTDLATAAAAVDSPSTVARPTLPAGKRVYLPVTFRRSVWARSQGQCEFTRHGRRCTSRHALEIDHETPLSLGGANSLANLRLLCRHHNLQQARQKLGVN